MLYRNYAEHNIHVSESDLIPISNGMVFLLKHSWLVSSRPFKFTVPRTNILLPPLINRPSRSEHELFLAKLSVATIIQRWWHMNIWVWSMGEMILTGRNRSTQRKTSRSATLSTINPTWPGLAFAVTGRRLTSWAQAQLFVTVIRRFPWRRLTVFIFSQFRV
jgi:hypothetical protein